MRAPLQKRSIAKKAKIIASQDEIEASAIDAVHSVGKGRRQTVPHSTAMGWLREVGVKKRRTKPPWK